jgi:Flp pilus assembly protein CpaB
VLANVRHTRLVGSRKFSLFGAVIAIIAFIAVVVFAKSLNKTQNVAVVGSSYVVVAKVAIPARTVISPSDLRVEKYPASLVPPGSYATIAPLIGKVAAVDIEAGDPVTSNLVVANPSSVIGPEPPYLPIPKGYVAMTIPTSDELGVGYYIQPYDHIDILATYNSKTFVALSNIVVLRVGDANGQTTSPGATNATPQTLTVQLTLQQAVYLKWLLDNAVVRYVLLSHYNYNSPPPPAPPVSVSQINSTYGL